MLNNNIIFSKQFVCTIMILDTKYNSRNNTVQLGG